LGTCVCRHGERTLKADIDEQEDVVTTYMEAGDRYAQPNSLENTYGEVKHVQDMKVPQGGVYTGQAREADGQPHGKGVQKWADGTAYNGTVPIMACNAQGSYCAVAVA